MADDHTERIPTGAHPRIAVPRVANAAEHTAKLPVIPAEPTLQTASTTKMAAVPAEPTLSSASTTRMPMPARRSADEADTGPILVPPRPRPPGQRNNPGRPAPRRPRPGPPVVPPSSGPPPVAPASVALPPATPASSEPGPAPVAPAAPQQWLADPKNVRKLIGFGGIAIGVVLLLAGDPVVKLVGLAIAALAWGICLRVAHTEKATFHIRTRLDREEVAGIAAELTGELKTMLSSVSLEAAALEQLDFLVRGKTWQPLEFHAAMAAAPDGTVTVDTELDSWTVNKQSVWFIPVPFTRTIDGFRLYKTFGDRWGERIQRYDPSATVEYRTSTR